MSKTIIQSNLDSETLSKILSKGQFEDYSERYIEDGIHTFPSEEKSVTIEIETITKYRFTNTSYIIWNFYTY